MNEWKDCVKEPSEIGKKVLCQRRGDFYVAMRIEDNYIPMPFADHYFCKELCFPEKWSEINYPDPYTGHIRVAPSGDLNNVIKLSDAKEKFPEVYWEFATALLISVGKIPKPEGMR